MRIDERDAGFLTARRSKEHNILTYAMLRKVEALDSRPRRLKGKPNRRSNSDSVS